VTRKEREPEALALYDGAIALVKHTHDVEEAERLAAHMLGLRAEELKGRGRAVWCRILGPLPGSLAEAEGWAWEYRTYREPSRGVFKAA
jgi:hypothetical protein